jgi:hypothetical protein
VEVELQAGGERRPELLEEMGFGSAVDVTAMAIHYGEKQSPLWSRGGGGGPPEDSRAKG